jgi:hypothetical protein
MTRQVRRSASCAHFGISRLALTLPPVDHVEERKTRSSGSICFGCGISLTALVLVSARRAWAQSAGGSSDWGHFGRLEGLVTILLIVAAALLLLIGLIAEILDLRLKRDGEVVAVKGVISDALGGDPELFELPLTATVRVPLWRGSPVTIRVFGEVPSGELKQAALRRVQRTAEAELAVRARIKSRIGVTRAAPNGPIRTTRSG